MDSIYIITVMEKMKPDDKWFCNMGAQRTVAWYPDFESADESVKQNNCDMWETVYDYAIVEEVECGMYPDCHPRWFYKYNEEIGQYEHIEEPECMKHLYSI